MTENKISVNDPSDAGFALSEVKFTDYPTMMNRMPKINILRRVPSLSVFVV